MTRYFCDGSSRNNIRGAGIGAYGYVAVDDNDNILKYEVYSEDKTTNNIMEMKAAALAIKEAKANGGGTILMDSNLVYRGITEWLTGWKARGWRKADKSEVVNKELWIEIDKLLENADGIFFQKVKGHSTDKFNNFIDDKVQTASAKLKEELGL